jgi:hypothetical protein
LATWVDLDNDSEADGNEEANLALMATASEKDKEGSEPGADSYSYNDDDEVIANLSISELIESLKDALNLFTKKAGKCKVLKRVYKTLNDKANIVIEENESLRSRYYFPETHYVYNE